MREITLENAADSEQNKKGTQVNAITIMAYKIYNPDLNSQLHLGPTEGQCGVFTLAKCPLKGRVHSIIFKWNSWASRDLFSNSIGMVSPNLLTER